MTLSTAKNILLGATTSLIIGCGSTGPTTYKAFQLSDNDQSYVDSKPQYLKSSYSTLFKEGKRNQVLNLLQIGKSSLDKGNIEEAENAFDQALSQIETVYSNNEEANRARSLWHEEGGKTFKGEPYERSMAYYYRGLVYLYKHEYDNARASFISGIMQDAFAEEEQNRSDFALLMFLAGWSAQKMGSPSLAKEAYDELKSFRPDFVTPSSTDDMLIIGESGKSPRKLADGLGHYQLVYRRGKKIVEKRVSIKTDSNELDLYPMEDVFWQASSRGGRPVDKIIEGKASFKKTAQNFGSGLSNIANDAMILSGGLGSTSGTNLSAAFSLVGVASMALSANTKPRADTRYWNNLPDLVHVKTFNSKVVSPPKEFIYKNEAGTITRSKKPTIINESNNQSIYWSSNN
jgi:tetratricopeptide (TPR) repeat protein